MLVYSFGRTVGFLHLALCVASSVRAGSSIGGEKLAPEESQVVDIAMHVDIHSLEPDQSDRPGSDMILDMVLETLVRFDAARRFIPAAATHWTHNSKQTVWRFHLRKEGKWSNGDPVKAEDFVRTYRNYCDPQVRTKIDSIFISSFPLKNAVAVFAGACRIEDLGVKAIDDYTLELEFERPVQKKRLLTILTQPMFAPLHLRFLSAIRARQNTHATYRCRHFYPKARSNGQYLKDELTPEEQEAFEGNPFISNGPFVITDLRFLTKVNAVKNAHYWDADNVILKRINWRFGDFTDRGFWQAGLRSEVWHITSTCGAPSCPRDMHAEVLDHWGVEYTATSTQTTDLLILNTRATRLQDLKVRQALDLLLNREAILTILLKRTAAGLPFREDAKSAVSYTLVPPRSDYLPEYRPDL